MTLSPEVVSTTGLALDLFGAILIGFEFFKKYKGDQYRPDAGLGIDPSKGIIITQSEVQPTDDFKRWQRKRERTAKLGFSFLAVGFSLQIAANWI
ncbi:hypothetical protein OOT55_09040 [Marinimicrobium sp. C6131]|uniref:hypothetical protein n=1 Tax=Marinimicrobium sp. C6131 TaxID=3022676 RepID=UPI00223C9D37|nr:hypothetical protein [Marinimicrobium sp. C6131]UZJ46174.1 hypothetical protein OOT55_09040 [Marinimicrobium sp. C6131]